MKRYACLNQSTGKRFSITAVVVLLKWPFGFLKEGCEAISPGGWKDSVVRLLLLITVASGVWFGLPFIHQVQAASGIQKTINFQGKVTNTNGTNVTDGTYDFVIKIYDGAGSSATTLFTESWTSAALWSGTMSSAPGSGGESLTYTGDTNEATLKVGQILWNTTKQESVIITSVNTSTNVLGISPTRQAWAGSDTVTNKIYVKDGVFRIAINSLNANLSGVNFGSDSLFVGVNFNADGEMKPRMQLRSNAYAFNSEKVNGLTVTNTSDAAFSTATTLKIGDGKTVVINNGLTFSGTDGTTFTFPSTTGTVVTLDATQTLTNKTIGSTGLVFDATTDITTGTNGALTIAPNGSGDVVISADADTNLQVTFGQAPGVDMVALSNTGFGTTATGVDGLQIDFVTAAVVGAVSNAGLQLNVTSGATEAGDTLYGINIGNLSGQTGTEIGLRIGTGWDQGLVIESGSNDGTGFVYSNGGRPTKTITLSPEYDGAVLTAFYGSSTDTAITGSITSDTDTSGNLLRNYYQWSSSQGSLNYYTVAVRVRLPKDFSAWTTSNAIQVEFLTQSTSTANNLMNVYIHNADDTPGTAVVSKTNNVSASANTWATPVTIDDSEIDDGSAPDWDAADESAVIYLRMGSLSSNVVRIGDIRLNYLAKF